MDRLQLSPVTLEDCSFLFELLRERDPAVNISHRAMPSWDEHVRFVESGPYHAWYRIDRVLGGHTTVPIGSIYLTNQDEIGLFFSKSFQGQGYGATALDLLKAMHPRKRYLANVAPLNKSSHKFFERRGFKPIQITYEMRQE